MTNKEASEVLKTEWDINAEIFDTNFHEALNIAIKALEERPTGKWIKSDNLRDGFYICSHCKEISCCQGNYCPDCGAQMRKGANNETN